jgi:pyruvate formate lyase activating enzyme
MPTTGRIHSFESFGTLDGPGIRYIVFMQGCPLRCSYCHNPDTWDTNGGKEYSTSEVVGKIISCRNYLRNGGVTLSGGEPLLQGKFTLELLQKLKAENFHTAIDTAGSLPLSSTKEIINTTDMLLLDIKALDDNLAILITGQTNKNTLKTLEYCEEIQKRIWIRHVLVPNLTFNEESIAALAKFLSNYSCIERVELLPYHTLGCHKFEKLNIPYKLAGTLDLTTQELDIANKIFYANFKK